MVSAIGFSDRMSSAVLQRDVDDRLVKLGGTTMVQKSAL